MKRHTLLLTAAVLAAACSDGTGPGTEPGVSLSFSTRAPTVAPAPGFFASVTSDTLVDGSNSLIITKAEIVLREIELKRSDIVDCTGLEGTDGCEEFEAGPVLVDLPLDNTVETPVTIPIPAGTYDELQFVIHKVTQDQEDSTFAAAYPDMVGKSIHIEGTYNGTAFTYETDLDVEQEFNLNPPLIVDDTTTQTNVTVLLDLNAWFRDGAGNLVNPQEGNTGGQYESLIKENIKQNIEAFEDHDHDGSSD